ncbi:MAG: hypothetical protein OEW15_17720 [Nitrospirota bacterium]|nr:hypothetical protein [Nitrospirota bacterium]
MKRLFFSQSMLDSMVDAGKIKVEQSILTMLAGNNPTFRLIPAYRFVKTVENVPDPARLVGHFRTEQDLKEMQAEVYMDSVIYKDIAYQADPGFIAEQIVEGEPAKAPAPVKTAEAPAKSAAAPAAAAPETPETVETIEPAEKASEEPDQLSKFILDNLL